MSKRAPELVANWEVTPLDPAAVARAIRSQRVKLHRLAAKLHRSRALVAYLLSCSTEDAYVTDLELDSVRSHARAAARFSSRADKIERGEL